MSIYNLRPYIGGLPLVGGYNLPPYIVSPTSGGGDIPAGPYQMFSLDGIDDRLSLVDSSPLNFTTVGTSFSIWLRTKSDISTKQLILGNKSDISQNAGYGLFLNSNTHRSEKNSTSRTFAAATNTLYNITCTTTGGFWSLYINGNLEANISSAGPVNSSANSFYVGFLGSGSTYSDIEVCNMALSSQEFTAQTITDLYNGGNPPLYSTLGAGAQAEIEHFYYLNSADDSAADLVGVVDFTKDGGVGAAGTSLNWS